MNLQDLNKELYLYKKYEECTQHKLNHIENGKKCGAAPIKIEVAQWLYSFCKTQNIKNILEIGTGTGFSTFILSQALPNSKIDTIEFHQTHIDIAKENLIKWTENKNILENINFICGEFPASPQPSQKEQGKSYDLIFFDGYSPNSSYLEYFEKHLKVGGILISGNSHLKKIDAQYFPNLANDKKWLYIVEFEDLKVYKKH